MLVLYKEASDFCQLFLQHYSVFAAAYPYLKCCKMVAAEAHAEYPDEKLPSLFAYHDGGIAARFFGLAPFGGADKLSPGAIATVLSDCGAVDPELDGD